MGGKSQGSQQFSYSNSDSEMDSEGFDGFGGMGGFGGFGGLGGFNNFRNFSNLGGKATNNKKTSFNFS